MSLLGVLKNLEVYNVCSIFLIFSLGVFLGVEGSASLFVLSCWSFVQLEAWVILRPPLLSEFVAFLFLIMSVERF